MDRENIIDVKEYPVKYPVKEKAYVIVPHNGIPFSSAAVGITYPNPDYSVTRMSYNINLFEYVVSGSGEVMINGEWRKASAGDLYILPQGIEHNYRSAREDPWEKLWINYSADYIPAFLNSYGVGNGIYRAESARVYFEELIELTKASAVTENSAFLIADRIHKIIRAAAMANSTEAQDEYGMRRLISGYVYKKLNLDELAAELHMSKTNVIRVFKRLWGQTPYDYLLCEKIRNAKILLTETKLPIREIADKLAISDEHYFSTVFYKKVGIRPSQYRKRGKEGAYDT